MNIDLCIISTLRPELLEQTLVSFAKMVKFDGKINPVINIDCVPEPNDTTFGVLVKRISDCVVKNIGFTGVVTSHTINTKGNFAQAVKTVWQNTTSDYVFHLEADWEFLRKIDLNECIKRMESENYDYIRFPKVHAPHLNCLYKVALQPSFWRGKVVRQLSKHMSITQDPEKQLRRGQGNEELDKILYDIQKKGLIDYKPNCCKDIGREWMIKNGYRKWKKGEPLTWQKV